MSASTSTPAAATLPDSEQEGPSSGNNGPSTTTSTQDAASTSKSKKKTNSPNTTRKRKDRNEDATEIESQASKQAESSSSTKRARRAAPDIQIPDDSAASTSATPVQVDSSVQRDDVSRCTGKRKQRDEDETPSNETSSTPQSSSEPTSSDQTSAPREPEDHCSKKQRLGDGNVQEETDPSIPAAHDEPKIPPFVTLPMELLADILVRTRSPQTVLAVARSCRFLCQTLLSPDAVFIWRDARKGCYYDTGTDTYELPDPPAQFFSEPGYAAFLFDAGPCDNCGNETGNMYRSFALRLRLCKRTSCQWSSKIRTSNNLPDQGNLSIIPTNEIDPVALRKGSSFGSYWPAAQPLLFRAEDAELSGYRSGDEGYETKFAMRAKRKIDWMMLCTSLLKWRYARDICYSQTARKNKERSTQIALENGWSHDLLMTTVYGPYLSNKTKILEEVNDVDLEVMRDDIEARLITLDEKRDRRHGEITLMNNRKEVEKTYNTLRSSREYPYLPSLHTFRKLSVVAMLQSSVSSDTGNISETFKNDKRMKDLLHSQLKTWTDKAKNDLGALLGFPKNWKNASKKVFHPAERLSARYLCTQCERFNEKYRVDECFDFAGACSHECGEGIGKKAPKAKKGKKAVWKSENFVKDEKAVKALKNLFEAFRFNDESTNDLNHNPLNLHLAVVCTSCSPSMVLDTRAIIGHSHRHDDMQLSLKFSIKDIITMMGGYPYEHGLVQKLLGSLSFTNAGKAPFDSKNYGCRHCLRAKQIEDPAGAAAAVAAAVENNEAIRDIDILSLVPEVLRMNLSAWIGRLPGGFGGLIQGPALAPPPLFNFNGLRSHLKAKHGIRDIRDEDVLCYRPPEI